jgi:hypothetical protein
MSRNCESGGKGLDGNLRLFGESDRYGSDVDQDPVPSTSGPVVTESRQEKRLSFSGEV